MATFTREIRINAPVERVWKVLSDIGNISVWNPGVVESHVTTVDAEGLEAGRRCDLGGKNYLDEIVTEWDAGKKLTMRIVGTNLPFRRADIRFNLERDGDATTVTVSPDYSLKYGIIGKLLDTFMVRRTYEQGMDSLLQGLKNHVEAR